MAFKINNTTVLSGTSAAPDLADENARSYPAVKIGDQIWMAKNLDVTHYRDGTPIPGILDEDDEPDVWEALTTGAYATMDASHSGLPPISQEILPLFAVEPIYGLLYNWYAVDGDDGGGSGTRELAPAGWHIPTDVEWTTLVAECFTGVEGSMLAGPKIYWDDADTTLTNGSDFGATGFNGLPAGYRGSNNGTYYDMGHYGYFWSSSEDGTYDAWYRSLEYNETEVDRSSYYKQSGFSVRCIKDT